MLTCHPFKVIMFLTANFNLQRTYKLGEGPSSFMVDIWIGDLVGQRTIIHVEPGTCTPIAQSTYGTTVDGSKYLKHEAHDGHISLTLLEYYEWDVMHSQCCYAHL